MSKSQLADLYERLKMLHQAGYKTIIDKVIKHKKGRAQRDHQPVVNRETRNKESRAQTALQAAEAKVAALTAAREKCLQKAKDDELAAHKERKTPD